MTEEISEYLSLKPGNIVVDCTVGAGGHSINILKQIAPAGRLIGIDQDEEILELARRRLKGYEKNCKLVYGNFKDIDTILGQLNIKEIDAVLYDLGVSSFQLDSSERGFSFLRDGPLDMRMDKNGQLSAFDLVNNLPKEEISRIIFKYGEERYSRRIASLIVEKRKEHFISSTKALADIVSGALPRGRRREKIHPATRTFQAFRIAVNNELEALQISLNKAVGLLRGGSRICVLSFQSLEDRIVKNKFRDLARESILKVLTKKPLRSGPQERKENPRSRSAKLRAAEKIG
ncbi:MAG: 16S rRNA (cytosine(1402)-N(4))-methyltransferase RsmH [Candidatus Omnitrophica bacterium]|nr:16S rRNA (cytosine(1402)-N(4))-methyltransferase RsmH [Candidatus Omnitrophota bacterium]